MALSGNISTNSYDGRYYKFEWSATQSTANNKSTISWTLSALGGNSAWYAERTLILKVNGSSIYSKTNRVERYKGTVESGSFSLTHTSSGECSFTVNIQAAVYGESVNLTASKTFSLDKILRQATLTSAPNFNDTQNPTIYYSNPAGNSVTSLQACISLTGSADDIAYRAIPKTGTSYTFNLTDAERAVLRNNTTGNSRTVYFYVKTTIGGTDYYSYLAKTFSIKDTDIDISITGYDTNSTTTALTGDNEKIIEGYSNYYYYISASADTGSVASISANCGDSTVSNTNSTTLTGTFRGAKSAIISAYAKDSRGNTGADTLTNTLIEYFKPTVEMTVSPTSTDGKMIVAVSGTFCNINFGSKQNTITCNYSITHEGSSFTTSGAITLTVEGNEYSGSVELKELDYKNAYEVSVNAYDLLDEVQLEPVKAIGEPIFDWDNNNFNFNVPVRMMNGKAISGYDTDGIIRTGIVLCNNYNYLTIGQGNYNASAGGTEIYGNSIALASKSFINLNGATTIKNNGACEGQFRVDGRLLVLGGVAEVAKQTLLTTDTGRYMHDTQEVKLTDNNKRIVNQCTGYILVWYYYDGSKVYSENINYTFIPKYVTALNSGKITVPLAMDNGSSGAKTLFVTDDGTKTTIKGHTKNDEAPNNKWVLKEIIGY